MWGNGNSQHSTWVGLADGNLGGRPSGQGHDPQTRCKQAGKQESNVDQWAGVFELVPSYEVRPCMLALNIRQVKHRRCFGW